MDPVKFKVGQRIFTVPASRISSGTYIHSLTQTSMRVEKEEDIIVVSEEEDEIPSFEAAVEFLLHGTFPSWEHLPIFDYLGIDPRVNYDMVPRAKQIDFIRFSASEGLTHKEVMRCYKQLLQIPDRIFNCLGTVRPWIIPQQLEWKVIDPGEQFTGSFHKTVLDNKEVWYQGRFYQQ